MSLDDTIKLLDSQLSALHLKYGESVIMTTYGSSVESEAARSVYRDIKRQLENCYKQKILEELVK
jgi:hypothetical protein